MYELVSFIRISIYPRNLSSLTRRKRKAAPARTVLPDFSGFAGPWHRLRRQKTVKSGPLRSIGSRRFPSPAGSWCTRHVPCNGPLSRGLYPRPLSAVSISSRSLPDRLPISVSYLRTKRTTISTMLSRRAAIAWGVRPSRLKIRPKVCWLETLKNVSAEIDA